MNNFVYNVPTKVVFGREAERKLGKLINEQGCKKVLLHFGGGSAESSGLLGRIRQSLEEEGVSYVSLGGVVPNPRLSKVYEGIELGKAEKVDFILAVGGGSVIDSAKAIAYGLYNDCDVWDIYEGKVRPKGSLPVGAVPTIAAAGSEMSYSSVITKEEGGLKRAFNHDEYGRCRFAVMNPELTCTLPPYQTASGVVDILMHTLERYFTPDTSMELTDSIAEGLLRTVLHNGLIAMKDPQNYDARAELMWAGSLSHNGITGCGAGGDWACHQIEHEVGGMFDVAHGAGLAAIWGSWARYVLDTDPFRFAQLAVRVLGVLENPGHPEETGLDGIKAMERYFKSIGMPTSLRELGVTPTDAQLDEMAVKCSFYGKRTVGGLKVLEQADMRRVLELAR